MSKEDFFDKDYVYYIEDTNGFSSSEEMLIKRILKEYVADMNIDKIDTDDIKIIIRWDSVNSNWEAYSTSLAYAPISYVRIGVNHTWETLYKYQDQGSFSVEEEEEPLTDKEREMLFFSMPISEWLKNEKK